VEDVGEQAMDTQCPFDQKAIFVESLQYLRTQLNMPDLDIIKLGEYDVEIPSKQCELVEPEKPYLWIR
jgi:hypothetical protein